MLLTLLVTHTHSSLYVQIHTPHHDRTLLFLALKFSRRYHYLYTSSAVIMWTRDELIYAYLVIQQQRPRSQSTQDWTALQ